MNPKLRLILIFLLVVSLGVGIGLMFTPVFHVQNVFCEGNSRIAADEISAATAEAIGKNIFLVRLSELRSRVEEIPMVEKASIRRVFPNQIKITVEECIPAGYLYSENQCVVTDMEGKVLDIIADERVARMLENYVPKDVTEQKGDDKEKKPEETAETISEETQTQETEQPEELREYSVPLVMGVEVSKPEIGKRLHSKQKESFELAFDLFRNLEQAGLLVRATYLDLQNKNDVILVIENRLEIRLGTPDNLEYRMAFLAKVINERMSATEHAVMDYRGADIYVRQPEDGKERMKPTATPEPTASEKPKSEKPKEEEKETGTPSATPGPTSTSGISMN